MNSEEMKTITTMKICQRYTNRRVRFVSNQMSNQNVIDNALNAADDVGQHGRPRQLPHRRRQRPLDNRAVVTA